MFCTLYLNPIFCPLYDLLHTTYNLNEFYDAQNEVIKLVSHRLTMCCHKILCF